jgi:L-asparagine oxygenase
MSNASGQIELYSDEKPSRVPYSVQVSYAFSDDERAELEQILNVKSSPYRAWDRYAAEVREILRKGLPEFFEYAVEHCRARSLREDPVFYLKNCPIGDVPYLDFDDPLSSKYELKKSFVAEAFLSVFAALHRTSIVTYRTANRGDKFHDIHPLRSLQYSMSQKTVNTLHFHTDLPDNRVRPDWVNLLSLRNSPDNEVFTAIVRVKDVFELDREIIATLRKPVFHSPRTRVENNISVYGLKAQGYLELKPVIISDRGYEYFCYNESYTTSDSDEGKQALSELSRQLRRIKHDLFLAERDFVAISNNACLHARHVVKLRNLEAHQHRWLLKTWNVDDVELHRKHFVPGRLNIVDE